MRLTRKTILLTIAALIGTPITLITALLIAYFGEFPLPMSTAQFEHDWSFKSLVKQGDQIIGGGYSFAEARDIWIRIRLNHEPDLGKRFVGENCPPEISEKIRSWFLEQTQTQRVLGLFPVSVGSSEDVAVLNDVANLQCNSVEQYEPLIHQFGSFPKGCKPSWILYHKPSRFYYERSACSH